MWLFEKRGFVSVVAYDPKKDRNKDSEFRNIAKQAGTHLLVRARIKADLDWLKETVPSLVIETDKAADYAFRAVITRKQYKRALAKSVDEIDYDSHFKEVVRDNSPKVNGRYEAMMRIWSAFANLQPYSPYGGYSWSGGGSYSTGSSTRTTYSGGFATPKPVEGTHGPGAKDVAAFLDEYYKSNGETTFRNGGGPRTGFKPGDRVISYSGPAEVVEVEAAKYEGGAESVKVKMDDKGRITTFISNYLMPEDLPDLDDDAGEDTSSLPLGGSDDYDLDWMYDTALKIVSEGRSIEDFPSDMLGYLDDDAFELLTRLQEKHSRDGAISKDSVNETYDEILWETSTDEERVKIWQGADSFPAKYEQDAIKLFNSLENSSQDS